MNTPAAAATAADIPSSEVPYADRRTEPLWIVTGRDTIAVRSDGTPIALDDALEPGADYAIVLVNGEHRAVRFTDELLDADVEGGFHYALGGCAEGREGGDETPAINPHSLWDRQFRAACKDPRGMVHVVASPGASWVPPFWCDIYPLAQDHLRGTSRAGATIADGGSHLPETFTGTGKRHRKLDYETAGSIYAHHGKGLLSIFEFFAAAYGATERQSADEEDELAGLDARRTSRFGLMQAVGQRDVWGHDGDPDTPRACWFGGRWGFGGYAGSRYAIVDTFADYSDGWISARGRSDHLTPES